MLMIQDGIEVYCLPDGACCEVDENHRSPLGIREDECFVVEDSTVGIEAAYRAGMSIAGLKDDRFGFDQSKADYHIDSISDILKYL